MTEYNRNQRDAEENELNLKGSENTGSPDSQKSTSNTNTEKQRAVHSQATKKSSNPYLERQDEMNLQKDTVEGNSRKISNIGISEDDEDLGGRLTNTNVTKKQSDSNDGKP